MIFISKIKHRGVQETYIQWNVAKKMVHTEVFLLVMPEKIDEVFENGAQGYPKNHRVQGKMVNTKKKLLERKFWDIFVFRKFHTKIPRQLGLYNGAS